MNGGSHAQSRGAHLPKINCWGLGAVFGEDARPNNFRINETMADI